MPSTYDAYQTTIGSSFNKNSVIRPLTEAVVSEDLPLKEEANQGLKAFGGFAPLFITGSFYDEKKIPSFPHPMKLEDIRGKNFICSDLRLTLREPKGEPFTSRIKNRQEFDFLMARHWLTMLYHGGRAVDFRTSLRFGAYAYGAWLSSAIGHLRGLDPYQRTVAHIVFMCFYYDMTFGDKEDRPARVEMEDWISSFFNGLPMKYKEILDRIGNKVISSIDDAVTRLKETIESPALMSLNGAALLASVKSHWFGQGVDSQKLVGVALEDPPTWCALVLAALTYNGYKNAMIAQIVTKLNKKAETDSFLSTCTDVYSSTFRSEFFRGTEDIGTPDPLDFQPHAYEQRVEDLEPKADNAPNLADPLDMSTMADMEAAVEEGFPVEPVVTADINGLDPLNPDVYLDVIHRRT